MFMLEFLHFIVHSLNQKIIITLLTQKNDVENLSQYSNKKVTNISAENCNIKSSNFITNESPESSHDEKCNKINNSTNSTTELVSQSHPHDTIITQKCVQKII